MVRETAGKLGAALPQCRNLTPDARRKGQEIGTATAAALAADRAVALGPIVRGLRREGKTLQAVADELNARGYVTRRGKPWTDVAVLRLLNRDDLPDPKGAPAEA